jgi:uncharacterized protein (TIGR02996 family)
MGLVITLIQVLPSNKSNLVYADWLEEYGEPHDIVKAAALRLDIYVLTNESYDDLRSITVRSGRGVPVEANGSGDFVGMKGDGFGTARTQADDLDMSGKGHAPGGGNGYGDGNAE